MLHPLDKQNNDQAVTPKCENDVEISVPTPLLSNAPSRGEVKVHATLDNT